MNLWMILKVSVLAILRNKTRSLLTCIGIIVGIAAVIAVLAIGKGASAMMVKEISSMEIGRASCRERVCLSV